MITADPNYTFNVNSFKKLTDSLWQTIYDFKVAQAKNSGNITAYGNRVVIDNTKIEWANKWLQGFSAIIAKLISNPEQLKFHHIEIENQLSRVASIFNSLDLSKAPAIKNILYAEFDKINKARFGTNARKFSLPGLS